MAIRVFLLDDHEIVRRGVRELLEAQDDIEVVGEAGTAAEGVARIPATKPDVAIVDMRLPDGNGVEVCREVRSIDGSIQCLILTSFSDDEALFDSIMAGAAGYLLKQIKGTDLVDAVRRVAAGPVAARPERDRARARAAAHRTRGRPAPRAPHRSGAQDPRSHRRGPHEPSDRRAALPRREDGEELRVEPALEARAWNAAPRPRCSRPSCRRKRKDRSRRPIR